MWNHIYIRRFEIICKILFNQLAKKMIQEAYIA